MKRVAASLMLAVLAGCAHAKTPAEVLADIDTSNYALPTDTGQTLPLAALRGNVVVLQFFATWCVPCLAEVNQLQKAELRNPEGVKFVSVAFDLDADRTLASFRQSTGVNYPLLIADEATRTGQSVFGRIPELPTTVVLDRAGVVKSAFTGLIDDAALDKLINAAK